MQAETTPSRTTRQSNTEKRYAQIRAQFKKDFTDQPYPKKYTREYIISQIALDWCLSMGTVENILYNKPAPVLAQPETLAKAA